MVLVVHFILVLCIFVEFSPEPLPPKKVLQGMLIARAVPVQVENTNVIQTPPPVDEQKPMEPIRQELVKPAPQAADAPKRSKPDTTKVAKVQARKDSLPEKPNEIAKVDESPRLDVPAPTHTEKPAKMAKPPELPIPAPPQPLPTNKAAKPERALKPQSMTSAAAPEEDIVPPRVDASLGQNPAPPYPRISRRLKEEGTVLLDIYILANGQVGEMRIKQSSGFTRLDQAARAAVAKWRYQPARKKGQAIAFWYVQPVYFSLTDNLDN